MDQKAAIDVAYVPQKDMYVKVFGEETLQSLIASLEDHAVILLSTEAKILSWNPGAGHIFGYAASETAGQSFDILYGQDINGKGRLSADMEHALREGQWDEEAWRLRKDGTRFRARARLLPLREFDGKLSGYISITRDLSERKEAEDRYRLLVNSVQDYAIFMLDPGGRIVSWNTGAERLKGWTANEIIGQHFSRFYTSEDNASGHPARELNIAATEGRYEEEGWRIRKNGERFWANVVITRLTDADGKMLGFSKVTRDLTERRRNEQALRESEERFRLMVESVRDYAIIMLDPEGNVVSWNAGAQRIKGWAASEIIGRHFSLFYPPEDVKADKMEYELRIATREGRFEDHGWRVRKDGTRFWANVIITALRDERGVLRGFGKVTRDISEQKVVNDALKNAHESLEKRVQERTQLLEAANRELESFSYTVSHDLRAPLRSMDGFSAALLKSYGDKLDERGRDYLARIRNSSQHMAQLIDDLLNLARLGRQEMRKETVNMSLLAQTIMDDLRRTEPKRSVDFVVQADIRAYGDSSLLKIMLENLLGNAWKYTGKREQARIEFSATVQRDQTVYSVRDNGAGFDMAFADRLFLPFQRLHRPDEFPGSGIGLATVKRIAQRHGGDVWGYSELAAGATFFFTLDDRGPN